MLELGLVVSVRVRVSVGVRVQIHQHDTQGQRTSAVFGRFPFYHCISRHLHLFPDLPCFRGGSSSTYPYIHITINTLQVELKNAWGATDLVIMKCVCSSAGITNTCHTTEESQATVVTPPKVHLDSLGCITVSEWGGP